LRIIAFQDTHVPVAPADYSSGTTGSGLRLPIPINLSSSSSSFRLWASVMESSGEGVAGVAVDAGSVVPGGGAGVDFDFFIIHLSFVKGE
jgi:hypothetical protein